MPGPGAPRTRDSIPFLFLDQDTLGPPQGLGTSVCPNPLSALFRRVWVLTICAAVVQILLLTDAVPDHRTENGLAHSCCFSPAAPERHTAFLALTALSPTTSVSFASLCGSPRCRIPPPPRGKHESKSLEAGPRSSALTRAQSGTPASLCGRAWDIVTEGPAQVRQSEGGRHFGKSMNEDPGARLSTPLWLLHCRPEDGVTAGGAALASTPALLSTPTQPCSHKSPPRPPRAVGKCTWAPSELRGE